MLVICHLLFILRRLDLDTLRTERLVIRSFFMEELDELETTLNKDREWAGPGITINWHREKLQEYITLAKWDEGYRLFGNRAIVVKDDNSLAGMCGFRLGLWTPTAKALFWSQLFDPQTASEDQSYTTLELEIGYALISSQQGRGYALEAAQALLDHAFNELQVRRVFAGTNRSNSASMRLMRRLGMRLASNPEQPGVEWPGAPGIVGVALNK